MMRRTGRSGMPPPAASRRPAALGARALPAPLLLLPALALVGLCFLLPLLRAAWDSLGGGMLSPGPYAEILRDPLYRNVLLRSFETGAVVTLLCLLLGYPIAYLLTGLSRRAATLLVICLLVPLFTAFLIRTYGWMSLLGRQGPLNTVLLALDLVDQPVRLLGTRLAVYIGLVHVLLPIAIFTMYASMARIDRLLPQAAQALGANPVQAFSRVYLPLSLPGMVAAAVLVFIMAVGFFITPVLLGSPSDTMVAQLIVTQITTLGNLEFGYALAVVLLAATLLVLLLANRFIAIEQIWSLPGQLPSRRRRAGGAGRGARLLAPLLAALEAVLAALLARPPWLGPLLLRAYALLLVVFMLAPLAITYLLSFSASPFLVFPPPGFSWQWYEAFFSSPQWRSAVWMSLRLALVVASLAVVMALAAAFGLVRGIFAGKRLVFLLLIAPLLVPVIIVALCLYVATAEFGLLGSFAGLVIGHLVVAMPYAMVVLLAAVRSLDRNQEYAAATLGAPPASVLRSIVLPALRPALVSAWIMAFLHSFDELLVTLFLLGRQDQTLPLKMWADIRMQFDPVISAASSTIVTIVAIAIIAVQWRRLAARGAGRDAR